MQTQVRIFKELVEFVGINKLTDQLEFPEVQKQRFAELIQEYQTSLIKQIDWTDFRSYLEETKAVSAETETATLFFKKRKLND